MFHAMPSFREANRLASRQENKFEHIRTPMSPVYHTLGWWIGGLKYAGPASLGADEHCRTPLS